ncbi:MAG TPA: hypothetical protein VIT00_03550 [Terrimicrobiaceae bacterium]
MDTTFLVIAIIASFVLVPLALLFIGGQLIRSSMNQAAATDVGASKAPSRFTRDLKGLEDALVEFFASSKASSCILTVLAAHGKPVAFKALVEKIRANQERRRDGEDLPTSTLRTVLTILQVVRLIHMNRDGFFLTDLGREVYRRMNRQLQVRAAVRQHGRRDYSLATSRASSSPLERVSAPCR